MPELDRYNENTAAFDFNGKILAGNMPAKETKKIREWINNNQKQLIDTWNTLNGFC